jgi:hypothetical protein
MQHLCGIIVHNSCHPYPFGHISHALCFSGLLLPRLLLHPAHGHWPRLLRQPLPPVVAGWLCRHLHPPGSPPAGNVFVTVGCHFQSRHCLMCLLDMSCSCAHMRHVTTYHSVHVCVASFQSRCLHVVISQPDKSSSRSVASSLVGIHAPAWNITCLPLVSTHPHHHPMVHHQKPPLPCSH